MKKSFIAFALLSLFVTGLLVGCAAPADNTAKKEEAAAKAAGGEEGE
ncbi:MAG: hypothetical protein ACKVQS_12770 [Fimbriimonadaceae bacterium]